MIPPSASIVIPTRDRLAYLEVALESIAPQAAQAAAEMLVVDDAGPSLAAGEFDVSLEHGGDEQEWQDRLAALAPAPAATPVLYVAAAALEHRRSGKDARLISLSRTAHARGRAARRLDARAGRAQSLSAELMTLARCVGHVVRRRCAAGLTLAAHSAGRVRQCLAERRGAGASSPGLSTPSGPSGSAQGARAAR